MKIAVLASRQDAEALRPALEVFQGLGIPAYALSITPGWIGLDRGRVAGYLADATHLLLVANLRSVEASWFGFAAGYATQLAGGLSLLRQDPAWEPPAYLRGFPIFEDFEEMRVYFRDKKGEWAAEERRLSARARILEKGISCSADAFATCVSEGDAATVKLFLEAGFEPDSKDRRGVTMLCLAVRNGHLAVAETLLAGGAAIDLRAEDRGYTPLMDAVKLGPPEHVAFFLDRGADVKLESKDGQTALVIAVGRKDLESARLLLEHRADPDAPDKLGMSARSYAKLFKQPEFMELFARFPPIEPD